MKSFHSFVGHKEMENKEHLHVLRQILEKAGFQVSNHLDDPKEPYVYVKKPINADPILESLSFGGVRLYTRGRDLICYRAQNKEATEPFGTAYSLDIKSMFKDMILEDKERIGLKIIFHIVKEIKEFFVKSAEAEKLANDSPIGSVVVGSGVTDYSNMNDLVRK